MAKKIQDLKFDDHNFNDHTAEGMALLEKSIKQNGFGRSVLVDKDDNLLSGNGVVESAIKAGKTKIKVVETTGDELVVVKRTDLDINTKEGRDMALADNVTAHLNLAWNEEELQAAREAWNVDVGDRGLNLEDEEQAIERKRAEFELRMQDEELDEDDEEYQEFLRKFEAKKTTNDCYTPAPIYDAVAEWVENEYEVKRKNFVRPFVPKGDYKNEKYKKTDIVVDNPPFSILAEIARFYIANGVRFFLFAPRTSSICGAFRDHYTNICTGVVITYDNGAKVPTSFITNLETEYVVRSSPSLYAAVKEADDKVQNELHKTLPRYDYPDNIVTAAMLAKYSKYGQSYCVKFADCEYTDQLDSQKETKKAIFGGGLLLSEKAAAEKAAAEKAAATVWRLSEREKEIIEKLSK